MTPRDRDIYHFIEMVGLCTAKQIKDVFIPNVDITKTHQRLRVLVEKEMIRVFQVGLNKYYYVGRRTSVKMLEHDLKTTELVGFLKKNGAEILDFKRNKIIGRTLKDNIFTDGYVVYKIKVGEKTYKRHIIIEVQRRVQYHTNPTYGLLQGCIQKYNHDSIKKGLESLAEENGFKSVPPLIVITDIKDTTSTLFTTNLIKLPYTKNESWDILIR